VPGAPLPAVRTSLRSKFFLVVSSFFFVLLAAEVCVRVYESHYERGYGYPQWFMRCDAQAGYDITSGSPRNSYYVFGRKYPVWSNELGCFDEECTDCQAPVLLVGDSMSFGFVPFPRTFPSLLESRLNARVLKCAVPGYGTRQQLIKARRVISKMEKPPRLLIIAYFSGNDFADDHLFPQYGVRRGFMATSVQISEYAQGKRRYLEGGLGADDLSRLTATRVEFEKSHRPFLSWCSAKSRVFSILAMRIQAAYSLWKNRTASKVVFRTHMLSFFPETEYPWVRQAWDEHLRTLTEGIAEFRGKGIRVLVVILPSWDQVLGLSSSGEKGYLFRQPNHRVSEGAIAAGASVCDLLPAFLSAPQPQELFWVNKDTHFTEAGAQLAADEVARVITEQGLLEQASK
jgi:hypothetical protein